MNKKFLAILLVFTMMFSVLVGCGKADNKGEEQTSAAGKNGEVDLKGQELSIYVSFHEDMGKRLANMFEEKTGVKVTYIRIPTGEAVTRMKAEAASPNASVWIGGTADAHENLKHEGILEAYNSSNEFDIPAEFKDPDGVWKGLYVETLSIGVNAERFEKEFKDKGIEIPKKLDDLLNPAFKGEIITPDPNTSGTGFTVAASILHDKGEEDGYKFLEELYGNVGQFTTSGFTPAEKTGTGEYLIALNFFADQLIVKNGGFPMESTVYENSGWNVVPVSKIKGGKNEEAAQAFIDFALTKEAADALVEIAHCVSVRDDAIAPEGGSPIGHLPIDRSFNAIEAAASKEEVVNRLSELK
ncbi:ABC transporter substrate-binding protein [Tissierellaceae bacterium HCP3S3_D8]